jgi:hypothetical protein
MKSWMFSILCLAQTSVTVRTPVPSRTSATRPNPSPPACTYYVSNSGNDSHNGTSTLTAWRTVAKINSTTLTAGTSVCFQRTNTWREMLIPGQSGTALNAIVFGAYGTGANPLINGSDLIIGMTISTPNVYTKTVTTQPYQLFINGVRGSLKTGVGGLTTNNDWYWAANTLYLYSPINPSGKTIEASARFYGVHITGKNYITVQDIDVTKANGIDADVSTAAHINLLRMNASWSSSVGFYPGDGGASYVTLANGTAHDNGSGAGDNNGIAIGGSESALGSDHITIDNMDVYNSKGSNIAIATTTNLGVAETNIVIQYCHLHGSALGGLGWSGTTAGTAFHTILAHHNLIEGNAGWGISDNSGSVAHPTQALLYQNTVYNNAGGGLLQDTSTITLKDNIFSADTGYEVYISSGSVLTSDYNDFYHAGNAFVKGPTSYNFAGWQGLGYDAHSVLSNPLFTNAAAGNFTLQVGSPAIGAGVFIPGVSTSNPPNMGAF